MQLNTKTVSTKDVEIILHKRVAEVKWQATHTLQYTKLGQPTNLRASIGPRYFGVWGLGLVGFRAQGLGTVGDKETSEERMQYRFFFSF